MRPKYIFALILAVLAAGETLQAQQPNPYRFRGGRYNGFEIEQGDTIISVAVDPLYVFAPPKNMKQYERLVRNVKKVYPYAIEARQYMRTLETELLSMGMSGDFEDAIRNGATMVRVGTAIFGARYYPT